MNTFWQKGRPPKIDTKFLNTLETSNFVDNIDDLLEAYLSHILQVERVQKAEVLLFNSENSLMPVAEAEWIGPPHKRVPKVFSECWVLDYRTRHTKRGVNRTRIVPKFSIPLMNSGTVMGFLNIQLDKLHVIEKDQLLQLRLIGLQLAASIIEIWLKTEIKEIKAELQAQVKTNSEILHQSTSLSKELYAISAISAKINQSMDFDKTMHRCLTTIRKVFKASNILIYTKNDPSKKLILVASESEADTASDQAYGQLTKSIQKKIIKEILQGEKPLVKELSAILPTSPKNMATEAPPVSLIGVPLSFRGVTIGVMILLNRSSPPINQSGMRLLSGMANILAMAIENKVLYRQSIQKKNEIDFMFRSIVKFNKTLDLKSTLISVAERGVEYCGVTSRVYLFSIKEAYVILSHYKKQKSEWVINSSVEKNIMKRKLKQVYVEISRLVSEKPVLLRSISHSRKIGATMKSSFFDSNIYSLVAVPLNIGSKKLGILLLVRGKEVPPFNQHDMQFAETLASAASLAIENARAYTASVEMSDFLEKKISQKTNQIVQIEDRERFRAENRKDIVFQVNLSNRFVFVNKSMEVLSGLPQEVLCHKDFGADEVVVPEKRAFIRGLFRKILTGETNIIKDVEYRHICHKGGDHVISLTIYPEYDQEGRVVGIEGVGRDITEKKRLKSDLKKARELALLGEFSSGVAHQMRNPLGNILMGTKRLESALGLDGGKWGIAKDNNSNDVIAKMGNTRIAEILKNLSQGVHNLNQVVTELLDYTRTLKLSLSSQRIDIIMRETVQMFANLIDQYKITVCEHFQDLLPTVPVDAVLIGQVIQNVIYNAIQAMPRGGELSLFVGMTEEDPDQLLLSVRDSGKGIDPSEINQVFRPFYTTKTNGTGLGLSLAHRIVEAHGGRIQICRNPCSHPLGNMDLQTFALDGKAARGTTVHVMLPTATASSKKTREN